MCDASKIFSILPLVALFVVYAVAMHKVAPCGTRRSLNTYSKESIIRAKPIITTGRIIKLRDKIPA